MKVWDRLIGTAADIGLGVLFATALAVEAAAIAISWGGTYWLFGTAAGALVSVLALARRRHLAGTALAGLAVAAVATAVATVAGLPRAPGPATALALAVLVGSAVRALSARPAGAVAAAGFAVVAGCWATGGFTAVPVLNAAAWLAAVGIGLGLRALAGRRRVTAEAVRRAERLELARELHDVVAHHITGIVVQTQAARLVAGRHPDRLADSLAGIEAAGSEALVAMRRVVGLLRDSDDGAPATPGPGRLSDLVDRFAGRGPVVRLRLPDDEAGWPAEVSSTVYRVVQESLTNVSRHAAHAHSVEVCVAQDRQAVTVEIADDAAPLPARFAQRAGYGLLGMRERVETLGGTLRAGPRPGAGWAVRATLPIDGRAPR